MNNQRKAISSAQNVALVTQVNRVCPICDAPLFYTKNGSSYKQYEIAHIYPLNPKTGEIQLLESEERLSEDVNHENNLIPLCTRCHVKFDKPITMREYKNLVQIKKLLIKKKEQQDLWHQYQIDDDINKIIESLYTEDISNVECDIDFITNKVDRKLNDSISKPTKRKIKHDVADYYIFIKNKFKSIDEIYPGSANLISIQIKVFYLEQNRRELSQQEIFNNIVDWIHAKTHSESDDAAEIIASFFIQNCEIFE